MSSYFETLGQALSAELSRNPAQRERLRFAADSALTRHLSDPGMARDALPRSLAPRSGRDQDPGDPEAGATLSSEECMYLIEKCIAGLDPDERDKLLEQLADFFQQDGQDGTLEIRHGNGGGGPGYDGPRDNNQGSLDRGFRSGRRGARDSRRPAQDSAVAALNHASFMRRFPEVAGIEVWAGWRR